MLILGSTINLMNGMFAESTRGRGSDQRGAGEQVRQSGAETSAAATRHVETNGHPRLGSEVNLASLSLFFPGA